MRTAQTIANEIKSWDKSDVRNLRGLLAELRDVCDQAADEGQPATPFDAYVEMSSLPTAEIPADVDTAYPIWAMDAAGRMLAGADLGTLEIITLDEYRANRAA